jgi:hypothetical protein
MGHTYTEVTARAAVSQHVLGSRFSPGICRDLRGNCIYTEPARFRCISPLMANQAHSKFKVFIFPPSDTDAVPTNVLEEVCQFVADSGVAPKSVGIEYLEGKETKGDEKIVLSLGYRDDEPGYPVDLQCVSLGKLALDPEAIGKALRSAAEYRNVICHEFYVTDEGEFFLVLLCAKV